MGALLRIPFLALMTAVLLMAEGFTLESPDIHGQLSLKQVYNGFGCHGENLSPGLSWHGEPKGTKSFAVTVYDPDAPTGSGWWHWLVFNIPARVHSLPRGAGSSDGSLLPKGAVQSVTDFGKPGYGGACPPPGDGPHRYIFTVYALDVAKLPLKPDTPPAMVGYMIEKHALAKASLMAYYGR
ncbi:YbhB/YbcL family Raf kinase inhibitor-like protein [Hydrogenimonas sp. SS33]|uniref:YbhB/YbcL family Raf kinase inhibitor-like protein n=1 Tax=Hydrogenimonas leucolamina TaxID=2954236 RepID=UPI00336C16FD